MSSAAVVQEQQRVSPKFNLEDYLEARRIGRELAWEISRRLKPGMSEEEGLPLFERVGREFGVEKFWHPHRLRIGTNTVKSFYQVPEPGVKLKEVDIVTIDIAPVYRGQEADFGDTFVYGDHQPFLDCQKAVREIFLEVEAAWRENQELDGPALYKLATAKTEERGYTLDRRVGGHRLGDFSHVPIYKGALEEFPAHPVRYLWVLEVMIAEPNRQFGGFFEDIMS